ncbi:hypothetical protein B0H19DRAFT_1262577 [Mycena capillaripes]|nr:hypothetical protein B0H19DRAFT_1262577 [Mycena capillaripes]
MVFGTSNSCRSAASNEEESATDLTSAAPLSLMSRRIIPNYSSDLDGYLQTDGRFVFGTDYDDYSPDKLQWVFGERLYEANQYDPYLPASNPDNTPSTDPFSRQYSHAPPSDTDTDTGTETPICGCASLGAIDSSQSAPEPRYTDELVLQSVVPIMGSDAAERCLTFIDHLRTLYTVSSPLPNTHYLSPAMLPEHKAAMEITISERTMELNCAPSVVCSMVKTALKPLGTQERCGYRDTEPHLFPGEIFHERLATHDPEFDDTREFPGF